MGLTTILLKIDNIKMNQDFYDEKISSVSKSVK